MTELRKLQLWTPEAGPALIDEETNVLVSIPLDHAYIHQGIRYRCHAQDTTLANNETLDGYNASRRGLA